MALNPGQNKLVFFLHDKTACFLQDKGCAFLVNFIEFQTAVIGEVWSIREQFPRAKYRKMGVQWGAMDTKTQNRARATDQNSKTKWRRKMSMCFDFVLRILSGWNISRHSQSHLPECCW